MKCSFRKKGDSTGSRARLLALGLPNGLEPGEFYFKNWKKLAKQAEIPNDAGCR
jgi:chorismate synthase